MARPPSKRPARKKPTPARRARRRPAKAPAAVPEVQDEPLQMDHESSSPHPIGFPIVGVGASAGGIEALRELLSSLPPDPGVALLIVQHLARDRESLLPEILSADSPLAVVEARAGAVVEPNHVYVIPPNTRMDLAEGHLRLEPRPQGAAPPMPIDFLFRSLAHHAGDCGVAVVLSGTGSDGAQGVREVKAAGGITIVQDPASARYDGMPRAAMSTDAVDLVLPPVEIAAELAHLGRHFRESKHGGRGPSILMDPADLDRIFTVLRNETAVDFSSYKRPTIRRRLQRRMIVNKVTRLPDYLDLLARQPNEVRSLYQDLLIHVTRFFRDPESFDAIATTVFPALFHDRPRDAAIRVWVPGCSTGEEAYSVTIALLEAVGDRATAAPVQVFATDLAENAIERARAGVYPENITADVSPERLVRFFTRADGGYRIRQAVRDLCVFARQDVTRDPPFSKLDLIVCRNLLIYLGSALQQRLIQVFHYALKPNGFLVLGGVETVGQNTNLFELIDKQHKIYARKLTEDVPSSELSFRAPASLAVGHAPGPDRETPIVSLQQRANVVLLERYAPPAVLVDASFQIVNARGHTGPFLELPPGEASLSILKMAREGLEQPLRSALQAARKTQAITRRENLRVRLNGSSATVALEIVPIRQPDDRVYFLVLFERKDAVDDRPDERPAKTARPAGKAGRPRSSEVRVSQLEHELEATREHLQSMIHDLEAANEELQSANEEILSSYEELQSTNEELDTAREELQSTNEEINTVNDELHGRNEELVRANSDLGNLLGSVQIAIVIVSNDLRIRRFTPMAEKILNLIATDLGRPIGHIKPNIDCPDLETLIREVVDRVTPYERDVQDRQGAWYTMRVRPYKNLENRIDGAVLALVDISAPKRHAEQIRDGQVFEAALLELVPGPVAALDPSFRVRASNRAWQRAFGHGAEESIDRSLFELGNGRFDVAELRELLAESLASGRSVDGMQLELAGDRRVVRATARRVRTADRESPAIVLRLEPVDGESASH